MSVQLDPSDEFAQWVDGLEDVILRRRNSERASQFQWLGVVRQTSRKLSRATVPR